MTQIVERQGRLEALRGEIVREDLDGYLVPRADEHQGEFVSPDAERLAWLTGFTGSAGLALVLRERAVVFSDGRYVLQLEKQTDSALWERRHVLEDPPHIWLSGILPRARIGYDPWLITTSAVKLYTDSGIEMVPVADNLIDRIWSARPSRPTGQIVPHPLEFSGATSPDKRHALARTLKEAGQDAAIVSDPASLCWLLNVRGSDVPFTPFALGFVVLHNDGQADLFVDDGKISATTRDWIGNEVALHRRTDLDDALKALRGKSVRVDPNGQPAWFERMLDATGATIVSGTDICAVAKASKNDVEQQGARDAHVRDGVALCRFLAHMAKAGPEGTETEISAEKRLVAFRADSKAFRGQSFSAISGAGENGAIIHYRATAESNRTIRPNELYLIDSGAQYADGTTDVTRTIWTGEGQPPPEFRDRYTRVLKGLIAIDKAIFPLGTAGVHLDALARTALWEVGIDFDHGTGHGVGSYLSVHEGPASISRHLRPATIEPGMIMSDEPGYYKPGAYGIRLENLILARPAQIPDAEKPFLRFETLTLAPFESVLIDGELLTEREIAWIDSYHARVLSTIGPYMDQETRAWLEAACEPLPENSISRRECVNDGLAEA